MNKKLTGIYAALFTPFDKDGKIMYDALQRHVDNLINQGLDGFYVNGSTGESFLMTNEERKKTLEAVIEANNRRVTIISHCGAIGTELSADLIRHSASLPVDAVSSVPPFYYKFSKEEIVGYYNDLANISDKPFIVYNMPKFSGVVITPDIMAELRKNPHIQGLKYTYNDFAALRNIKISDPDLIVYNGFDEMCICGMAMGCDGAIGSTYNLLGPIILRLKELCAKNDFQAALTVQTELNDFFYGMILHGKHFAISKYMISKIEGIYYGTARKPFIPLTEEEIAAIDALTERLLVYYGK